MSQVPGNSTVCELVFNHGPTSTNHLTSLSLSFSCMYETLMIFVLPIPKNDCENKTRQTESAIMLVIIRQWIKAEGISNLSI